MQKVWWEQSGALLASHSNSPGANWQGELEVTEEERGTVNQQGWSQQDMLSTGMDAVSREGEVIDASQRPFLKD